MQKTHPTLGSAILPLRGSGFETASLGRPCPEDIFPQYPPIPGTEWILPQKQKNGTDFTYSKNMVESLQAIALDVLPEVL